MLQGLSDLREEAGRSL